MTRRALPAIALALLAACGSTETSQSDAPETILYGTPAPYSPGGSPDQDAVPARCTRRSYEYAIADRIDGGGFAFDEVACDGKYLTLRVDLGSAVCPPEATKEERQECAREKVAFFVVRRGAWDLITYEESGDCDTIQRLEPSFPDAVCDP